MYTFNSLLKDSDAMTTAHLYATQKKELGAWLNAFPMSALGLHMDDEMIQIAIGLRVGVPLCILHKCQQVVVQ